MTLLTDPTVAEHDAICRVVQRCLDGEATGDAAALREVFHPDARVFGSLAGERLDVPIGEFIEVATGSPTDSAGYRTRILAVHRTGDVAVAVVAEEGCWGTVSFVDYLPMARIDGTWRIVGKLFAHTAGEPPAAG